MASLANAVRAVMGVNTMSAQSCGDRSHPKSTARTDRTPGVGCVRPIVREAGGSRAATCYAGCARVAACARPLPKVSREVLPGLAAQPVTVTGSFPEAPLRREVCSAVPSRCAACACHLAAHSVWPRLRERLKLTLAMSFH